MSWLGKGFLSRNEIVPQKEYFDLSANAKQETSLKLCHCPVDLRQYVVDLADELAKPVDFTFDMIKFERI